VATVASEDEDFEFHAALEAVAPAAVRTLIALARRPHEESEVREEAIRRLRQLRASGLLDGLPIDLRRRAERLLREA
jgi:hypothetical protein